MRRIQRLAGPAKQITYRPSSKKAERVVVVREGDLCELELRAERDFTWDPPFAVVRGPCVFEYSVNRLVQKLIRLGPENALLVRLSAVHTADEVKVL